MVILMCGRSPERRGFGATAPEVRQRTAELIPNKLRFSAPPTLHPRRLTRRIPLGAEPLQTRCLRSTIPSRPWESIASRFAAGKIRFRRSRRRLAIYLISNPRKLCQLTKVNAGKGLRYERCAPPASVSMSNSAETRWAECSVARSTCRRALPGNPMSRLPRRSHLSASIGATFSLGAVRLPMPYVSGGSTFHRPIQRCGRSDAETDRRRRRPRGVASMRLGSPTSPG